MAYIFQYRPMCYRVLLQFLHLVSLLLIKKLFTLFIHRVSEKRSIFVFENFVKFPPILINFGRMMAK